MDSTLVTIVIIFYIIGLGFTTEFIKSDKEIIFWRAMVAFIMIWMFSPWIILLLIGKQIYRNIDKEIR